MREKALILAMMTTILGCGGGSTEAGEEVATAVEREIATGVDDGLADAAPAGPSVGAPRVDAAYQRSIDRGWEKAVAGDNPATACAGLKGRLMAREDPPGEAEARALHACNVEIPVRYFETYLDRVARGEKTCRDLMTSLMTELSAMTLSIEGMEDIMAAFDPAAEEAAAAEALATAVDDTRRAPGGEDPKAAIKTRIAPRVGEVCPEIAPMVTG